MKSGKSVMNLAWFGAIAVCVVLSVFALIFTSCTKYDGPTEPDLSSNPGIEEPGEELTTPQVSVSDPGAQPSEPSEPSAPADPDLPAYVLGETADGGREYLDRIVFLGDSTTYGIGYYYNQGYTELCPPDQIWTPSSGTLTLSNQSIATVVYPKTGEEIPIVDAVTDAQPDIMLLTLGVNGVSFMDEQWFIDEYTALINTIKSASPNTKIILNSIYPVAKSYQHIESISNEKISDANVWIKKIADDTGSKYLNTYEALVSEDGSLPEASHNGDGIHLNGETFEVVMEYIRTHAYN